MAQVQFVDPAHNTRITANIAVPKSVTKLSAWLSKARKAIPEIPLTKGITPWEVEHESANSDWIRFDLRNRSTDKRVYVVIIRQQGRFGEAA